MATRQREKSEKFKKTRDKRPTAIARHIRITPDKVEIVLDLIRGKTYEEASVILRNTNKSASPVILKVLNSAAANAENNLNIAKDNLYVAECWTMAGPTLKRMMTRARGSANRILKRTSHIRIILGEKEIKEVKKQGIKKQTAAKEIPVTQSERPLTKEPNAKKPLGMKTAASAKVSKDSQNAKSVKTAPKSTTVRTTAAAEKGGK